MSGSAGVCCYCSMENIMPLPPHRPVIFSIIISIFTIITATVPPLPHCQYGTAPSSKENQNVPASQEQMLEGGGQSSWHGAKFVTHAACPLMLEGSTWDTHAKWCTRSTLRENNYLSHTPYGIWTKTSAVFYEQLLHETELFQVCRLWYTESMVFMTWLHWVACWGPEEERIPVLRQQCWSMHLTGMALEFHTWKKTVTLIKCYAELMHGTFCQEIQVFFPSSFYFFIVSCGKFGSS